MPDGKFVGPCYRCKSEIWLPTPLYEACKRSSRLGFFCPYGHEQIFAEGETEATKLRRERDRLAQQLAQRDDEIKNANTLLAQQGWNISRLKAEHARTSRRISRGVCPCCHRTFNQMARHMRTKHPDFRAEEVA
jgi:hypothetical protein